jgi:universal stress protein E
MKRLLTATDFSNRSENAVRRAVLLSRDFSARLQLMHVVDADQPDEIVEQECRQALKLLQYEARSLAEAAGREPDTAVRTGSPFEEIIRTATQYQAELVVMGSYRRKILQDIFVGTTIERVMRIGKHPVLMVNQDPAGPYRRVMVAVDMSDPSANALRTAKGLGLLDGVSFSILHAFDSVTSGMMVYAKAERERVDEYAAREAAEARRKLTAFVAGLGLEGVSHDIRVEEGPAFDAIRTAVDRDRPDLLVIGTRGLTGVKRVLLGSVADAVLRTLECDILAVPPASA